MTLVFVKNMNSRLSPKNGWNVSSFIQYHLLSSNHSPESKWLQKGKNHLCFNPAASVLSSGATECPRIAWPLVGIPEGCMSPVGPVAHPSALPRTGGPRVLGAPVQTLALHPCCPGRVWSLLEGLQGASSWWMLVLEQVVEYLKTFQMVIISDHHH